MSQSTKIKEQVIPQLFQIFQPNQLLPGLTAGVVNGVLLIIIQISFAVMIFSSNFPDYVPTGIGLTLFGGFTLGLVTALTSSFYGSVAVVQDSPAAILAVVATAIVASMPASATSEELFLTLVAIIIVSSLLTGLSLFMLGRFKLGFLVRFLPYPVVGGFLAGTGWLLVLGGIGIVTDISPSFSQLPQLFQMDLLVKWVPGLIFAVVLLASLRRYSHFLIMPSLLLAAVGLFYLALFLTNSSLSVATAQGWLMEPFTAGALWQPLLFEAFGQADWLVVFGQMGNVGAILLISVISLLLNVSGLELTVRQDIDLNRELQAVGIANIVAGFGGSPAGYHALSLSALGHRLGAKTRLVGLITAGLCGAALFFGASLLSFFPKPVLGGLVLFLGLDFLTTWAYDTWFKLPKAEYALIILILVVIGAFGFLTGVTLGLLAAIVLFVINYSRINVVRYAITSAQYQSRVMRSHLYQQLFQQRGDSLYILEMQGFIFFGNAHRCVEQIKERINSPDLLRLRFLLLDFRLVTGIDPSATLSFYKLKQLAQSQQIQLVFTHLSNEIQALWKREIFKDEAGAEWHILPDLDQGVAWCEEQMIDIFTSVGLVAKPKTLLQHLDEILPKTADEPEWTDYLKPEATPKESGHATRLGQYLECIEVDEGQTLIREGEETKGLYFVEAGQVVAQTNYEGQEVVLRILDTGTVFGEINLYSQQKTIASVVASRPSVLYYLSAKNLERMEAEDPELAIAFHRFIAGTLGRKLTQTSYTVRALLS